jgi:hypothetical protein
VTRSHRLVGGVLAASKNGNGSKNGSKKKRSLAERHAGVLEHFDRAMGVDDFIGRLEVRPSGTLQTELACCCAV